MSYNLLEQASLASWPSLLEKRVEGGLLRYARGYSHRANSLIFNGEQSVNAGTIIGLAESFYRSKKAAVSIRICNAGQANCLNQSELDKELHTRSYQIAGITQVMAKPLSQCAKPDEHKSERRFLIKAIGLQDWLAVHYRIKNISSQNYSTHFEILSKLGVPHIFLLAQDDLGMPVATGFGTLSGNAVGVYGMATDARFRRLGLATQIVSVIENWGAQLSGSFAYLQVESANATAFGLYQKLGFKKEYSYWYRISR